MSTTVKKPENSGHSFDPVPPGMHHAVCYSVVDLGVQKKEFQNETKWLQRVLITFELPDERIEYEKDGEKLEGPRVIGKEYTASLHEKAALRKDLESWRGKGFTDAELRGFDISKLLGANALINVQHNKSGEKTYANIASINPLMKGTAKKEPENPVIHYEIEMGYKFPENLPEWIVNKIKQSQTFTEQEPDQSLETDERLVNQAESFEETDESLPF